VIQGPGLLIGWEFGDQDSGNQGIRDRDIGVYGSFSRFPES
jgi:hypothetical protein